MKPIFPPGQYAPHHSVSSSLSASRIARFRGQFIAAKLVGFVTMLGTMFAPATRAQVVIYTADFEVAAGYTVGSLSGQNSWAVSQGSATVTSSIAFSGVQSVSLLAATPPTIVSQSFTQFSGQSVVFVDFYSRPTANTDVTQSTLIDAESSRVGFAKVGATGEVYAFDGNGSGGGTWVTSGVSVPVDTSGQAQSWVRFTFRQDFTAKRWSLYVNGALAKFGLGFRDNSKTAFSLFTLQAAVDGSAAFDYFYISTVNPLFADTDSDGLPDTWENQQLGTLGYGPNDDPGGVGRPLVQSYQQSLSPWPAATVASGLQAWYRADFGITKDANNKVSQWLDLSGRGGHVLQTANAAKQPLWVGSAMNSKPAVEFSTGILATAAAFDLYNGSSDLTMVAVVVPAATQGNKSTIFSWGTDGNLPFGLTSEALNRYELFWAAGSGAGTRSPQLPAIGGQVQIITVTKSGTISTGFMNGTLIAATAVPTTLANNPAVVAMGNAAYPYYNFNGQIAEVLFYNRALNATERQSVESVLAARYVNSDSDSDGLPDAWEMQQLGTLAFGSGDDPGATGRTLLQSYQQALRPWPTATVSSGLQAWYRADLGVVKDANSKVSQWTDLSGRGGHVVQTVEPAKQPVWVASALNSKPAVQFSTGVLATRTPVDLYSASNDLTVVAVIVPAATQGNKSTIFSWGTDGNLPYGLTSEALNRYELFWAAGSGAGTKSPQLPMIAGQVQIVTVTKGGVASTGYINGTLVATASVPTTLAPSSAVVAMGNAAYPYYNFNGAIAEVLVYNRSLSAQERQDIEAALTTRYVNPDSDGDGLPDTWEMQHLGVLTFGAGDDPGSVGRTLLQSYQQSLSPWPVPTISSGLQARYRADLGVVKDANNKVSQWTDLSGRGGHVVQTIESAKQPLWVASAMNVKPAVQFSTGILATRVPIDLYSGNSDLTMVAVVVPAATQGNKSTIFSWGTDGNLPFGLTSEALNRYELFWAAGNGAGTKSPQLQAIASQVQIISVTKNTTVSTGYINGTLIGTTTVPATLANNPAVVAMGNAAYPYYNFNGHIAEVLFYNRALSATERQSLESDLTSRYVNPDSDADGLPDAWEMQHLGTLAYNSGDDPGSVARTLLQSYQQSLSPWPAASVASGLQAWYRADLGVVKDANNKVSQWTDLSGRGGHVVQTVEPAKQPLWVASSMNSKPAIQFSTGVLASRAPVDLYSGSNDVTVVAVVVPGSTQGNKATIFSWGTDGNLPYGLTSEALNRYELFWAAGSGAGTKSPQLQTTAGQVQIISVVKNSTTATGYITGASAGTTTVPATLAPNPAVVAIGNAAYPYYNFNGTIAEVLFYNRALSLAERQSLESALYSRYLNEAPSVSVSAGGSSFVAPASFTLSAAASDADGTVTKVEFFQDSLKIGETSAAPYQLPVTGLAIGSYSFRARATDNSGATTDSSPVTVTVAANQPPTVSITAPVANATLTVPVSITITASAADADGSVAKVEFYQGTIKIGESTQSPFSCTWSGASVGAYPLTAKATDNLGATGTSAPIAVTVGYVQPTSISGIRLYLKAGAGAVVDGNSKVSTWQDQSGLANHAVNSDSGRQPSLVTDAIKGRPAVRFNGYNSYLQLPNLMNGAMEGEIFAILKINGSQTAARNLWGIGSAYNSYPDAEGRITEYFGSLDFRRGGTVTQNLTQPHLYNVSAKSGTWENRLNSITYASTVTNTVSFSNTVPALGWPGHPFYGTSFDGDIAEIIVYDRVLTAPERQGVNDFLADKYGIAVSVPTTPANFQATVPNGAQVMLAWSGSGAGATYLIERSTGGGAYTLIAVSSSVGYTDSALSAGATYTYRVKAFNALGASAYSSSTTVTAPAVISLAVWADDTDKDGIRDIEEAVLGSSATVPAAPDTTDTLKLRVYQPKTP